MFCLSDGTPLTAHEDAEQETLVRPPTRIPVAAPTEQYTAAAPPQTAPIPAGTGSGVIKFVAIGIGLLLLLVVIGGAAAAFLLWPRSEVATVANTSINASNTGLSTNSSPGRATVTNNSSSTPKNREDELAREIKRREDERKRLDESRNAETNRDDDPPAPSTIPAIKDRGPTRLSFARGSTGTTVSGTISRERSYMLRAMAGQYLNASVRSSGGCVVFSSGGASTQFSTGAGDTYLYLRNTCSSPTTFSMSVNVR
jgi:hypothetical protein